jgi:hypothetical protein
MNNVYYFDSHGACMSVVILDDLALVEELGERIGASSHIQSELRIPINRARNVNGELVDVDPVVSVNVKWAEVREKRGLLLIASDWTALQDAPLSTEKRSEWMSYRQALRDITGQSDPANITWPTPP